MNHFTFSACAAFITSFLCACVCLFNRGRTLRIFGLYWLSISLWSFCVGFQSDLLLVLTPRVWGWCLHLGAIFIPFFFYLFTFQLTEKKNHRSTTIKVYLCLSLIFLILNTFTNLFTSQIIYRDGYAYPKPEFFYAFYFVFLWIMIFCGTCHLVEFSSKLPTSLRMNLIVFLFLHGLAYVGALDNFLIMIDIRIFPLYPYGLYLASPYAIAAIYLVFRGAVIKPFDNVQLNSMSQE
jgi:hypothetical protein